MKKKRKKVLILLCVIAAVLIVLYFLLVNFLVSAALVPSFMQKLEAFERITDESYAAQVQTSDIKVNRQLTLNATEEWLQTAEYRKLSAKTADGYTLIAEEFPAETDSHKWVLVLHGYTGWKEEMYPFAYWYHEQGYHVIVPDLRCQGESEGDFIGMGWTDHYDCVLWLDHILEQDADAGIILHGQSMGASTALMMAGDETISAKIDAVVSDCAYTDAYSMFGEKIKDWFHLPAFPLIPGADLVNRKLAGYGMDECNAKREVEKATVPILFIHGENDTFVPCSMCEEIYEHCASPKSKLIVEGAAHAESYYKDRESYERALTEFIGKTMA